MTILLNHKFIVTFGFQQVWNNITHFLQTLFATTPLFGKHYYRDLSTGITITVTMLSVPTPYSAPHLYLKFTRLIEGIFI